MRERDFSHLLWSEMWLTLKAGRRDVRCFAAVGEAGRRAAAASGRLHPRGVQRRAHGTRAAVDAAQSTPPVRRHAGRLRVVV